MDESVRLYRAVSTAELMDIVQSGQLRAGPPSFQGKWFAESALHAVEWGRRLFALTGIPVHLIEVEVPRQESERWHREPFLDRIGPALYAEITVLPLIRFLGEIVPVPLE